MKRILISALLVSPFLTFAGGFQLNVQGAKAVGMGGAATAVGTHASTVFFNPAAMTNLSGHNFTAGISLIDPKISLQTAENANINQTTGIVTPIMFYYSGSLLKEKFDDKLKVGLSINNQFGSKASFNDNWQGRNIIQDISLTTFMFQPTLAYKIHEKLSLGAGFVFTTGAFNTSKAVPVGSATTTEGQAKLNGSGTGVGFNIGLHSKFLTLGDAEGDRTEFALGLDYRSQLKVNLNGGNAAFTNIPTSLATQFPATQKFNSKITLPSVFTTGISIKHVTEKWSLEFAYDLNLTGWSSYDSLNFDFANATTPDSKTFQGWKNVLTHRFGVDFTYQNKYSVRAGTYYDNTPMQNNRISPHLPGVSQFVYTFGLGYKVSDMLSVDFGYIIENKTFSASLVDANFSAKYHRIANIFNFGINIKLGKDKTVATPAE